MFGVGWGKKSRGVSDCSKLTYRIYSARHLLTVGTGRKKQGWTLAHLASFLQGCLLSELQHTETESGSLNASVNLDLSFVLCARFCYRIYLVDYGIP